MESDLESMEEEETIRDFEAEEMPEAEEAPSNDQYYTDAIKIDETIPERRIDSALEFEKKLLKRPEDLSARTIQQSIKAALADCSHQTCTTKSITSRVLKKLGIRTRGNPWAEFDRRVKRNIGVLKRKGIVEEYKAKNKRLRLIDTDD
jgi:hypothetical protein